MWRIWWSSKPVLLIAVFHPLFMKNIICKHMYNCFRYIGVGNLYFKFLFHKCRSKCFHNKHSLNEPTNPSIKYVTGSFFIINTKLVIIGCKLLIYVDTGCSKYHAHKEGDNSLVYFI